MKMKFPYLFSFLVTAFDVAHALQVAGVYFLASQMFSN